MWLWCCSSMGSVQRMLWLTTIIISAIHAARKAFITSEASEKIKLALKKNIRNYQRFHELGDYDYYKQDSSSQWKGPAKVLGQDGPVLFLRHKTKYIKAHICRVKLTSPLWSKHSETHDKQVKAVNSQNNTENNIVKKIESSRSANARYSNKQ